MDRTAVVSSNVASAGYDPEQRILEVEFRGGSVYQYAGVPVEVYQEMCDPAVSVGRFLATRIKDVYTAERVE